MHEKSYKKIEVLKHIRYNTNVRETNISLTCQKNSIEFKIENYIKNHEDGKIPINKCFNDLFGIRIICNEELPFDKVRKLVSTKYSNLKCIDSSKNEYKATHI